MSLGHETIESVMEKSWFAESGGQLRINEDDYVAMTVLKPDSSSGKNFMLSKWISADPDVVDSREQWHGDFGQPVWSVAPGGVLPIGTLENEDNGPGPIAVIVNGTAASYTSVPVHWTLSSDYYCFDDDDILIGFRAPDLSSNLPYVVGPSWGEYRVPSVTPNGVYWLCAGIDAYGTLSETDTTDNVIISERLVQVTP